MIFSDIFGPTVKIGGPLTFVLMGVHCTADKGAAEITGATVLKYT